MYELLPFWHTLFSRLGFEVVVSPFSNRKLYQSGQATIPSDTACFPAKLSHGHIHWLCEQGVDAIFYPCMSYNWTSTWATTIITALSWPTIPRCSRATAPS